MMPEIPPHSAASGKQPTAGHPQADLDSSTAPRLNFASDNVTPACPEVMAALIEANQGSVPSYGEDELTGALNQRFSEVFETETVAFPIVTGTAANAVGLSAMTPGWGGVLCDQSAHINVDEGGAPEFLTSGSKLTGLPSPDGRMSPDALQEALALNREKGVLAPPFKVLSLTQATEWGTVYEPAELKVLTATAHGHGLATHMDGARLSNAIAHLNCTPAETTSQAGVDMLVFGGTKNGAMAAEAILFFLNERTRPMVAAMPHLLKRSGHLWSKERFMSAQLLALLKDDLWLRNGRHANAMAQRLLQGLLHHPAAHLPFNVQGNEVFVVLPDPTLARLEKDGYRFYRFPTPPGVPGTLVRFVTSFYTRPQDVDALLAATFAP
ncbi:threonine aldolase family protein [Oecophyllibacter saccharovorans]|uniref:Low specificity L-threonine aldolase n=1 Tax=Oecophyllibacter saccharovorans TaxID=2558360 RepID=A0A506URP1_9PROT|nr:low specificity L-threonine aldolase [Oecophyllibacter saccharovorans]QDH14876.1 low specificity L-threonine aldolase [Oecophyllibacter saccharovorans]TPW35067.1 low specificity L-threonine aldolase [Oecophyllibacter saccharovorans]TPW36017.1 low specificity L-threonine aldolase [Oecophyllibacter saccharovorans]